MKFLTFDIEDWFHILDNPLTKRPEQWETFPKRVDIGLDKILELCSKHKCTGIFFCLGWVADKYPELILKIHNAGHLIGSHGYAHQLIYEQSREAFKNDILKSIDSITTITKEPIKVYRAPGFSITKDCLWAFDVLAECGIHYDFSVFPATRSHGGLKLLPYSKPYKIITREGHELIEFPINIKTFFFTPFVFSGGGYFRITPLLLLNRLFRNEKYIMTYFHPRDFDPVQPIIPGLNTIRKFKSYYGLTRTYDKLSALMEFHKFDDFNQLKLSNYEVISIESLMT